MMVDSALVQPTAPEPSSMDRLDAAQALIGAFESKTALETVKEQPEEDVVARRPRSGSVGLDELAALAAGMEQTQTNSVSLSCSSDEDSEAMPPPPRRRPRSSSNPEGMEKWGGRRDFFVLPSAILEEELAEASALAEAHKERCKAMSLPIKKRRIFEEYGSSPDSVTSPIMLSVTEKADEDSYVDEEDMEPEELLRRARSRLLEDLSEGALKGEKGVLMLPHSLSKYKETYNKNGRIGIYTPAERAAIIARFHSKRSRRVWNKKIRYGCRKNLADRRLRVKGRFVKRTTALPEDSIAPLPDVSDPEAGFVPTADQPFRRRRRHTIT
jgi:hypothetical protein